MIVQVCPIGVPEFRDLGEVVEDLRGLGMLWQNAREVLASLVELSQVAEGVGEVEADGRVVDTGVDQRPENRDGVLGPPALSQQCRQVDPGDGMGRINRQRLQVAIDGE